MAGEFCGIVPGAIPTGPKLQWPVGFVRRNQFHAENLPEFGWRLNHTLV